MLQALADIDHNRAAGVLSLAARHFLPQPGELPVANAADREAADRVISEISARATKAKAQPDIAKVQEELSREISAFFLGGTDQQVVRARVGDKGALSPASYEVFFSPKFENGLGFWGVSKGNVLSAIARCDAVQHFSCTIEGPTATSHVSLFAQQGPDKRDAFTVLVRCQRVGAVLTVDEAYWVYAGEIDAVGATSPLDLLMRFLDNFGAEMTVSLVDEKGKDVQPPIKKLLLHEEVFDTHLGQTIVYRVTGGSEMRYGPITVDGPIELTLSFAVRSKEYADQLTRHGVKTVIPRQPLDAYTFRTLPKLVQ